VKLHLGDCLEVLTTLADASVDLVVADLPYGVTKNPWDVVIPLEPLWAELLRVGKLRCAYVFTATQPFATTMINSQRRLFRYDLVWDKTRTTGFLDANRKPMRRHESVLMFYRKQPTYNPQKKPGAPWVKTRAQAGDRNYGAVTSNGHKQISEGPRYPTSIVTVPSGNKASVHPTQKPVALLEWLIKTYSNPGDTVLDPTMGSGTAGVACLNTARGFIGIEKDAGFFATAQKRIAEVSAQTAFRFKASA
jgi:site-specific DNA-methyltransferase (adenine-specific)